MVAVLLGMKAHAVLHADRPGCGTTEIEAPEGPRGADALLVALVAGSEAEGRLLHNIQRWHTSTEDARAILHILGGVVTQASAKRLSRAKGSAAELVRRPPVWQAIETVAAELARTSAVTDASIREAVVAAGLTPGGAAG